MAKPTWPRDRLLALLLSLAAAAVGAAAPAEPVMVAESRSVADYDLGYRDGYNNLPNRYQDRSKHPDYAEGYRVGQARRQATGSAVPSDDYVRGYGDGLNGKESRDRDSAYRDGHRAGRAQHETNAGRADGRDYARGYREGYNRYRERAAEERSGNRAYAAGFRAGQAKHTALVTAPGGPAAPPIGASPQPVQGDKLVGRPAVTLDRDMNSLGFALLDRSKKGKVEITTWQSRNRDQCMQITAVAGKVRQVVDDDNTICK